MITMSVLAVVAGLIVPAGGERAGRAAVRAGRGAPVRAGPGRGPRAGADDAPPGVDRLHKVNMQIVTMPVPAQDGITRDNVTVRVDAVVYFKVVDPVRAVVDVQDYRSRGRAGRADLAALDHRQERPRRSAVQPRAAQPGPGADDRQPGAGLGRAHRPGRDQGRGAAGVDEAVDVAAGRGRAGAAGPGDQRGRRAAGVGEAGAGGRGDGRAARPRCSCGCWRPWCRSRRRRTPRWCCPSRSSCCASWNGRRRRSPSDAKDPRPGVGYTAADRAEGSRRSGLTPAGRPAWCTGTPG